MILVPPSPTALGFAKSSWRPGQRESVSRLVNSDRKYRVLAAGTGSGKSLTYMAAATLLEGRYAVLTSTRALQEQLGEFPALYDIRGMANYPCLALPNSMCHHGPCLDGAYCSLKNGGCIYYDRMRAAAKAPAIVTNYACWLTNDGIGAVDTLICDEGGEIPRELNRHHRVEIPSAALADLQASWPAEADSWVDERKIVRRPTGGQGLKSGGPEKAPLVPVCERLSEWAAEMATRAADLSTAPLLLQSRKRALKGYRENFLKLARTDVHWIADHLLDRQYRPIGLAFEPLRPSGFLPDLLQGAPQVIFSSATIRPKTLEILGIPMAEVEWIEVGTPFPKARRPVIHVPTMRMDRRAGAGMIEAVWTPTVDRLVEARLDRKGFLYVPSYQLARDFIASTSFPDIIVTHDRANQVKDTIARFRSLRPPALLVSPSIRSGVDFAMDSCEYIIIGKLPFPDTRSAITRARGRDDKDHGAWETMETLVQVSGRGMRSATDMCEVLLLDDHASWFLPRFIHFAPPWFMEAVRLLPVGASLPAPPPKLRSEIKSLTSVRAFG